MKATAKMAPISATKPGEGTGQGGVEWNEATPPLLPLCAWKCLPAMERALRPLGRAGSSPGLRPLFATADGGFIEQDLVLLCVLQALSHIAAQIAIHASEHQKHERQKLQDDTRERIIKDEIRRQERRLYIQYVEEPRTQAARLCSQGPS